MDRDHKQNRKGRDDEHAQLENKGQRRAAADFRHMRIKHHRHDQKMQKHRDGTGDEKRQRHILTAFQIVAGQTESIADHKLSPSCRVAMDNDAVIQS